jgi:hypothetical protein
VGTLPSMVVSVYVCMCRYMCRHCMCRHTAYGIGRVGSASKKSVYECNVSILTNDSVQHTDIQAWDKREHTSRHSRIKADRLGGSEASDRLGLDLNTAGDAIHDGVVNSHRALLGEQAAVHYHTRGGGGDRGVGEDIADDLCVGHDARGR